MNKESSHLKTIMSYNKIGLKGNHTLLDTKTKGTMIGAKSNQREQRRTREATRKPRKSQEKAKRKPTKSQERVYDDWQINRDKRTNEQQGRNE